MVDSIYGPVTLSPASRVLVGPDGIVETPIWIAALRGRRCSGKTEAEAVENVLRARARG